MDKEGGAKSNLPKIQSGDGNMYSYIDRVQSCSKDLAAFPSNGGDTNLSRVEYIRCILKYIKAFK